MLLHKLLLTNLFLISNFVQNYVPNNSLERKAILNYAKYLETHNIVEYNENFVDNLYSHGFYDSETTITVLTHGMFGDRDYWFPKSVGNEVLYFDSESLPYKIIDTQQYNEYNIPILSFTPILKESIKHDGSDIVDVKIDQLVSWSDDGFEELDFNTLLEPKELFGAHTVFIYNLEEDIHFVEEEGNTNSNVSKYFCKSLDTVLARLAMLRGGKLPRINLIGHSRGGLLNLTYAAKRKNIVDNFITIGSPLNGSYWADFLNSLCKLGRYFSNADFFKQNYDGLLNDIDNNEMMLSSLNGVYKEAIACEITPDLFMDEIISCINILPSENLSTTTFGNNSFVFNILNQIYDCINNNPPLELATITGVAGTIKTICNAILPFATGFDFLFDSFTSLNPNTSTESLQYLLDICVDFLQKTKSFCNNLQDYDSSNNNCIKGDFCVDYESQYGGRFSNNYFNSIRTIPFGAQGYNNLIYKYLSDPLNFWVAHNYESIYPVITNEIVDTLLYRNSIKRKEIIENNIPIEMNPYRIPFYNLKPNEIQQFYFPTYTFFGNEFGFRDYYYYESEVSAHPGLLEGSIQIDDFIVETNRMRTGYIQNERIVMSPNRANAGLAFIEFYFSEPVNMFYFDASFWSENELINSSSLKFAYSFNTELRDFIFGNSIYYWNYYHHAQYSTMTARGQIALTTSNEIFNNYFDIVKFDLSIIPTDRDNPVKMAVSSEEAFTFVGFYTCCNVTSQNRNKGRICLSNFGTYTNY